MLSVKILVTGQGWRPGRVLGNGCVAVENSHEVVPPARIQAIVHYPREQTPHEAPNPTELGWLVLLGVIFFETKRTELEEAAWPEWRDRGAVAARAQMAQAALRALAVTASTIPGNGLKHLPDGETETSTARSGVGHPSPTTTLR